ncbi:phage tail sheath subtilisin-like domain-containing protein [Hafnia alvei]|uniref:phage tail sheath subtilisin-like domain-containing protein n=1 Tax=Hafnia alvei TaxID=569 RepID=UPI000B6FFD7C|nr:phage tail sheath subtilisin-like domain-containing protein [Hafnia alvei]MBI0276663.1 phage tail sheath subtilisin-like domain-containing protein [Hafnia alvei]MBI0277262.1 phage tail sheath subtilisin-like domain-containing protein [Hafnia alvei]PNK97551.1 phage tail protein [Hafnia alvei]PNL03585.1 phage tail protein [Hafnia alvei]
MSETFHHGARVTENTDVVATVPDIDSSIIGVVCIADDADEDTFPLNKAVTITRVTDVLGKAGITGTLYTTLKAISDQCSPKTVVVRVSDASNIVPVEGVDPTTQDQLVIGGTDADGQFTGMYAFLTADDRPRNLACPGLDTQPVADELIVIAKKIRAFCYVAANGCTSVAQALTYQANFADREVMVLWPNFISYNVNSGENETVPAPAHAVGLRALIDSTTGWHKTLSNVPVSNIMGMDYAVYWALQSDDTDADQLNEGCVTTLIKNNGYRFWGNRTCDKETFIFESYTRTAQILADTIAQAQFGTIDAPLTPTIAKGIVDSINQKLASLVTAGKLLGASCWYETADNTSSTLMNGKCTIRYDFTPVPPLEDEELIQTFTDEYFSVFDTVASS